MNQTGVYRGIHWKRHALRQMLHTSCREQWYFVYENGNPTGAYFRTVEMLQAWVDQIPWIAEEEQEQKS